MCASRYILYTHQDIMHSQPLQQAHSYFVYMYMIVHALTKSICECFTNRFKSFKLAVAWLWKEPQKSRRQSLLHITRQLNQWSSNDRLCESSNGKASTFHCKVGLTRNCTAAGNTIYSITQRSMKIYMYLHIDVHVQACVLWLVKPMSSDISTAAYPWTCFVYTYLHVRTCITYREA